MGQRDSFVFYRSFYEAIAKLKRADQAKVTLAICDYALNGTEPRLEGISDAIFTLVRPNLDANQKKFENGKKGGRPKTEGKPKENLDKTTGPFPGETEGEPNHNPMRNADVDGDVTAAVDADAAANGEVDAYGNRAGAEAGAAFQADKPPTRFLPPSVEEVRAYCKQTGALVEPSDFVDFYSSKGWMVGKSEMKDWRAAVRRWGRSEQGKSRDKREREQNLFMQLLEEEHSYD